MANGVGARLLDNLTQTPLGAGENEAGLQAPFNQRPPQAVYFVRNLSAIRERNVLVEPVSPHSGGEKMFELGGPYHNKSVSLDTVRKQAERDPIRASWWVSKIEKKDFFLKFDGQTYEVPAKGRCAKLGKEVEAPWVAVPEGIFDLYYGNWERLNDPRQRAKEIERVALRRQPDPVVRGDGDNPYGFLEFLREPIEAKPMAVDSRRVMAGDIVEV